MLAMPQETRCPVERPTGGTQHPHTRDLTVRLLAVSPDAAVRGR